MMLRTGQASDIARWSALPGATARVAAAAARPWAARPAGHAHRSAVRDDLVAGRRAQHEPVQAGGRRAGAGLAVPPDRVAALAGAAGHRGDAARALEHV